MKKYLIAGLIILLPAVLTIMVFAFLIDLFTAPFLDGVRNVIYAFGAQSHHHFPPELVTFVARIIILILICIFTLILGMLARWFFFRSLIHLTDKILSKIPFIRTIFKVCKDVATAVFSSEKKRTAFQYAVMAPFPSKKSECVSFVTGEIPKACSDKVPEKMCAVFIPTAPHPISGYLVLMPEKNITKIEMTNEEAVKFTVSCGVILPEDREVSS